MADLNVGTVRESRFFMRTVASIVLVTYSALLASPGVQAMQQASTQQAALEQAAAEERSNFGKALGRAKQELRVLADRPDVLDRKPTAAERAAAKEALRVWRSETRTLIEEVRAEFAATRNLIEGKNLPEIIRQRHAEASAKFETEVAGFEAEVDEALLATDEAVEMQRAEAAWRRLDAGKLGRGQQDFNPNNLPNAVLKPDRTRAPKTKPEEFQTALLLAEPTVRLAQAGGFDFSQLPGADNPSYLAASVEAVLTPDIQAKADELNRNPVEIYNWVRNNVHWQPTWGAIQDASHTLSARRGNAFDIASLTIALLRASGIPARYVHGTIELPEDKFRNWAGGFEHIDPALDFASSGGIPIVAVTAAGRIAKVRLEHVWVEAALDFAPSRGAKNRSADAWVAIDPSFKQIELRSGLDAAQIAGIDPAQLTQDFLASGSANEAESWATGFNPALIDNAANQARTAITNHIQQNLPNGVLSDVLGGRRIIQQTTPLLAAALPNRVVATGVRFASVPTSLQQRITFGFGRDILGDAIAARTFPWAQVNNKPVILSFRPATAADESALRALLPAGDIADISQLPTSIPAYLVRVVPELKVDGAVVMTGAAVSLGTDVDFLFNPTFVGSGTKNFSYKVPAGSYLAVAAIAGSTSEAAVLSTQSRIAATRDAMAEAQRTNASIQLASERVLGDVFHLGLLNYYTLLGAQGAVIGNKNGGRHHLAAGLGTFGHEPQVQSFFGVPRSISGTGVTMNIPIVSVVGSDSLQSGARRAFALQLGALSSTLEHEIPGRIFARGGVPGEGISAIRALMLASESGQRIYTITPANQATVLPSIRIDSGALSEIRSALSAGKHVVAHTTPVAIPGWSGAGYIIQDTETGDAAWKISGGANGGDHPKALAFAAGAIFGGLLGLLGVLAMLGGGLAGIVLLFVLLTQIILPILLIHMSVYWSDPELKDCWQAGVALGAYVVLAIAALFASAPLSAIIGGVIIGYLIEHFQGTFEDTAECLAG